MMLITDRSLAELVTEMVASRTMLSQLIVLGEGDRMKYSMPFKAQEIVVFKAL